MCATQAAHPAPQTAPRRLARPEWDASEGPCRVPGAAAAHVLCAGAGCAEAQAPEEQRWDRLVGQSCGDTIKKEVSLTGF